MSSPHPHVLIVHELVGGSSGMGRVLESTASAVLERGWDLTVLGSEVTSDLDRRCRVIRTPAWTSLPSLAHYRLWAARAELLIRRIRERLKPDVVHVHSPALLRVGDLMTCHYLAFAAHARGVRPDGRGWQKGLRRGQAVVDRTLDDRAYRRRPPTAFMSFVSKFLHDEFVVRYGRPRGGWILPPASPPWRPVAPAERTAARARWRVGDGRVAVGFLGGNSQLKGVGMALELVRADPTVQVLLAGPRSEELSWVGGGGLGVVDPKDFLEACDVLLAPSLFDSAPVAVLEAVARGVPVVVTPNCGWAAPLRHHDAGVVLTSAAQLLESIHRAAAIDRSHCAAFTREFSLSQFGGRLVNAYREVLAARPGRDVRGAAGN